MLEFSAFETIGSSPVAMISVLSRLASGEGEIESDNHQAGAITTRSRPACLA